MSKPYVMHVCKNKLCNAGWLDIDDYNAKTYPPKWRYCPECQGKGMISQKDPENVEKGKRLFRDWQAKHKPTPALS